MDFQFQDDDLFLAKILVPEGTEDVQVGTVVALVVENVTDIPEVQKTYQSTLGSTPAPAPAPVPAKPTPAPAPAPTPVVAAPPPAPAPAPVPAQAPKGTVTVPAPAPSSAPATATSNDASYLAFDNWGLNLARGGLGSLIAKQQKLYTDIYGYTGYDPLPVAEDEKKSKGGNSSKGGDDDKKSKK